MSANQNGHGEKSPLAGDSEAGSPNTQASGSSNTISDANATQGSDKDPSTPPSPIEPTINGHLDLSALEAEPAPETDQDCPPRERPRDEATARREMSEEIARIMTPFNEHNANTERDPKPPSDS